jgi:hypothetical protein
LIAVDSLALQWSASQVCFGAGFCFEFVVGCPSPPIFGGFLAVHERVYFVCWLFLGLTGFLGVCFLVNICVGINRLKHGYVVVFFFNTVLNKRSEFED